MWVVTDMELLPAESIALTVALAQTLRGDDVPPNTAAMCVLALARITGRHDYTADDDRPCTLGGCAIAGSHFHVDTLDGDQVVHT